MEDDSPVEAVNTPNTPRNWCFAWKISIPYVDFWRYFLWKEGEKGERIPVFCIDVERNDRKAGIIIINALIVLYIKPIWLRQHLSSIVVAYSNW